MTAVRVTEHLIGKTYRPYILYTCACAHSLFERDHIFNVVGRNRQVFGGDMYASSVAEWRYGVRCAPCGVWAVRACGARARERERAEAGDSGAERRGQQRETASPMVLHCVVGEEVAATFGDTEDLSPRAPPSTLPAFYLSVKKKKILRSKDTDVRFTELLIGGGKRKKYRYRP